MTPPMSLPAEREALYKMIALDDKVIARTLVPEDFHDPVLRTIFVKEAELLLTYGTGDFVSICEAVKDDRKIQELGGSAFLAALCTLDHPESPTPGIIRILKSRRIERDMLNHASKLSEKEAKDVPGHLLNLSKEMGQLLPTEEGAQKDRIAETIKEGTSFISSGYSEMDNLFRGGFKNGALYTFAARPGGGKSTLLTNIAASMLTREIPFYFASLEMMEEEVMIKILSAMYNVTDDEVMEKIDEMMSTIDTPFTISDNTFTLEKLQTEILTTDAPIIFVDYIQLIRDTGAQTKLAEVTNITRTLKLLAQETKKPIVTASQMSRDIEKDNAKKRPGAKVNRREPSLSDLRESGSIEQDCNVVGFLWDPDPPDPDTTVAPAAIQSPTYGKNQDGFVQAVDEVNGKKPDNGPLHILIRKNRTGPEGTIKLYFDKPRSRIYEKI